MFELLQATGDSPPPGANSDAGGDGETNAEVPSPSVTLDRATIVTDDLDRSLAFYSRAFRWDDTQIESRTLRVGQAESRLRRARGQAGQLLLELVEPHQGGADPYARHLARGDHGLVHAGGVTSGGDLPAGSTVEGEWLEDAESFALYAWSGGSESLQIRAVTA